MSTLARARQEDCIPASLIIYIGVSVFCIIFSSVYYQFSHDIHSAYMTWLFVWPIVLGCVPCLTLWIATGSDLPGAWSVNLYHSGVAAVTVSSALHGILAIAGTSSVHAVILMWIGVALLLAGIILYIRKK